MKHSNHSEISIFVWIECTIAGRVFRLLFQRHQRFSVGVDQRGKQRRHVGVQLAAFLHPCQEKLQLVDVIQRTTATKQLELTVYSDDSRVNSVLVGEFFVIIVDHRAEMTVVIVPITAVLLSHLHTHNTINIQTIGKAHATYMMH